MGARPVLYSTFHARLCSAEDGYDVSCTIAVVLQEKLIEIVSKESLRVPRRISLRRITTPVQGRVRCMSTQTDRSTARLDSGSIFSSNESAWKHILGEENEKSRHPRPSLLNARRQTMTESEKSIIRELLDEVFEAKQSQSAEALAKAESMYEATESITKKRKTKGRFRKSTFGDVGAIQVQLDEMKQNIDNCSTKVALLQWAQTHVSPILEQGVSAKKEQSTVEQLHLLQHLVPILMRTFRQRFDDPNLALFMFRAVRYHSAQSYVYGCTAPTYNELITLLWDSFRDLQGIRYALEEMLVNSVEASGQTEVVAERACREAMNDKLWLDHTEEGDQAAMATLSAISDLLIDLMAAKDSKAGEWGRRKRDLMLRSELEEDLDQAD